MMLPTPPNRPYLCGSEKQEIGSMLPVSLIDTARKKCLVVSAYSFLCVLADTMFNISVHMETRTLWPLPKVQMPASQQPHRFLPQNGKVSQALLLWTPRDKGLAWYSYLPIPSSGLMWKAKLGPRVCDVPTLGFWMMSFSADFGGHGLSFCHI